MSVFPYAYRMIESFNITQDASQIPLPAGMLITAFTFAERVTGVIWGRISDCIGRKPVFISGLFGTLLSMISLGLARTLPAAIMARALGGLLNGNAGVLQTTIAELMTRKKEGHRAYAITPVVWSIGSIIGSFVGGSLAVPCDTLGFRRDGEFNRYPFLLPNLVCVTILLISIIVGILFLEETHADKSSGGGSARQWVKMFVAFGAPSGDVQNAKIPSLMIEECEVVNVRGSASDCANTESSPLLMSSASSAQLDCETVQEKQCGFIGTFDRQTVSIVVANAILA